jgi:hypothetical protein
LFSEVSLDLTRDAEGSGHCGPGIFTAEECDGIGKKGARMLLMLRHLGKGLFSATAEVSRFPERQLLD